MGKLRQGGQSPAVGPHDEQWQSGIEAPVGVAPEPGSMGIREGRAHRRMVAAACDSEVEHLLGCENWTPAWGRHSFSFLVLGASSFRVVGLGEGGSEEGRANTCFPWVVWQLASPSVAEWGLVLGLVDQGGIFRSG